MKYLSFLTMILISLFSPGKIFSQQTKILTAEKHNDYGLVYTLPTTAFEVEVTSLRQVKKAGPFYQYAKRFVGTDKVIKEDEEVWTISSIRLKPYGIPDPENRYLMQLKSGATTYIAVGDEGMLLAINARPEPAALEEEPVVGEEGIVLADNEYLQYVEDDFNSAISSFTKAQILADELSEIRDAKLSLTRGTAETMPTDGRQLEIMLSSLARQEAALTAAFTGSVNSETVVRKFTFIPDEEGRTVLFRMSDFAGPVGAEDYSGEPVYVDVKIVQDAELPVDSKGEEKKLPKDAVAYVVPGVANISLQFRGKTIFNKDFEIAQYGFVFGLNPSIFTDKKEPSFAIFDPATGALKELGTVKD